MPTNILRKKYPYISAKFSHFWHFYYDNSHKISLHYHTPSKSVRHEMKKWKYIIK